MQTKGYTWWQAIWHFYLRLIVGVLPAVVLGLSFNDFIESHLGNVTLVAVMLIVIAGMVLMSGSGSTEETFNPAIFDARHIKVAPAVCLFGYLFMIYAIVRKPRG